MTKNRLPHFTGGWNWSPRTIFKNNTRKQKISKIFGFSITRDSYWPEPVYKNTVRMI